MKRFILSAALISVLSSMEINSLVNTPVEINTTQNVYVTPEGSIFVTDMNESKISQPVMLLYKTDLPKQNYIKNDGSIIFKSINYKPDTAVGIVLGNPEHNVSVYGDIINNGIIEFNSPVYFLELGIYGFLNKGSIVNNGTITVNTSETQRSDGIVVLHNDGLLSNTGTININADITPPSDENEDNIYNAGEFELNGISVFFDSNASVQNSGTIDTNGKGISIRKTNFSNVINSGSIKLTKYDENSTGPLVGIYTGGNAKNASVTNSGTILISDENLYMTAGIGAVENNGTISNTGTITINDLNVSKIQNGILVNTNNGTISNTGTISNNAVGGEYIKNISVQTNTGTVINNGTLINHVQPSDLDFQDFENIYIGENNGTVINYGKIYTNNTGISVGTNNGIFTNYGTIEGTSDSGIFVGMLANNASNTNIVNNGLIDLTTSYENPVSGISMIVNGDNNASLINNGKLTFNITPKNGIAAMGVDTNTKNGKIINNKLIEVNADLSYIISDSTSCLIIATENDGYIGNYGDININITHKYNINKNEHYTNFFGIFTWDMNGTIENKGNINISYFNNYELLSDNLLLAGIATGRTNPNNYIINDGNIAFSYTSNYDAGIFFKDVTMEGIAIRYVDNYFDNNGTIINKGSISASTTGIIKTLNGISLANNFGDVNNSGFINLNMSPNKTISPVKTTYKGNINGILINGDNDGNLSNNGKINISYKQTYNFEENVTGINVGADNNGNIVNKGDISINTYDYNPDKYSSDIINITGLNLKNNNYLLNKGTIAINSNYINRITAIDVNGSSYMLQNDRNILISENETTDKSMNASSTGIYVNTNKGLILNNGKIYFNSDLNTSQVDSYGIYLNTNSMKIQNKGVISGFKNAIFITDNNGTVENDGILSAIDKGINIQNTSYSVINKGTIISENTGIYTAGGNIDNSGNIYAKTGIYVSDSDTNSMVNINNTGTINASTAVEYYNTNTAQLYNTGTITGSVKDESGNLTFLNNGTVYIKNDTNDKVNSFEQVTGSLNFSIDTQKQFNGFLKANNLAIYNNKIKIGFSNQKNIVQWYNSLTTNTDNEKILGTVIYYQNVTGLSEQNLTSNSYFNFTLKHDTVTDSFYLTVYKPANEVSRTIPAVSSVSSSLLHILDNIFSSNKISNEEATLFNTLAVQNNEGKTLTIQSLTPQSTAEGANVNSILMSSLGNVISSRQNGLNSGDIMLDKNIWFKPFYKHISQSDKNGVNGYSANIRGIGIGMDKKYDADDAYCGMAFFYADGTTNINNTNDSSDIKSYSLTFYGGRRVIDYKSSLSYYLTFALQKNTTSRNIYATNITANGSYTSRALNANVALSNALKFSDNMDIIPSIALTYRYYYQPSYTETGAGALDLKVNSYNENDMVLSAGANSKVTLNTKNSIFVGIFASYNFINKTPAITSALAGADDINFQTDGLERKRVMYKLNAGFKSMLNEQSSLSLGYYFKTNFDGLKENAAAFKYNYKF
ncbi:hypothetical protein C3L23_01510 [Nautilia sp. PV-1]|uniref:autotransporter outer membrane beta-barrel domain-containing protein n=1 Tax=Nautilia sp. PV-1 TaxID=2579250 RepID=UPI000FD81523|nr:autotransporter outer membrane beta-barrel domain-containing protein [Nautilia sp. PV-1]AZV45991.1 hypothetical protein C3L23_01510 [Nautilia sp. PV-1]